MDKNQALPEPYAEVFIWWNNNGSVQRRVARLQADRKAFQLSTYLADTKGQYLASLDRVLRWEPIVSAGEFSMPDLSKADLAAAPVAPVAAPAPSEPIDQAIEQAAALTPIQRGNLAPLIADDSPLWAWANQKDIGAVEYKRRRDAIRSVELAIKAAP